MPYSIAQQEYAMRRQRLVDAIGSDGIAIVFSGIETERNYEVNHLFRQESDFFWLTGFTEPDAVAVIAPGSAYGDFLLFCREQEAGMAQWLGPCAGTQGACDLYGADQAWPFAELDDVIPELLAERLRLYYFVGRNAEQDQSVFSWCNQAQDMNRSGATLPQQFVDLRGLMHEFRLIKSPAEQELMRAAGKISAAAHQQLMAVCKTGMNELDLEAEFLYQCQRQGARFLAYPSIVASGANGCILHYTANASPLRDGDLVMVDAGCELACYAADISRTFPVNGRFSPAQKDAYQIVLTAQQAAIEAVKPGNSFDAPHQAAVRILTQGLKDLGILHGNLDNLIDAGAFRPYYMHRTSHWLGLDVHDRGEYMQDGDWRILQVGMVITIEPGLYFPDQQQVPVAFRNMGIRIEDDMLVTHAGGENLTASAPKEIAAIEDIMSTS